VGCGHKIEYVEVPVDRPVLIIPPASLIRSCYFPPESNAIEDVMDSLIRERQCHNEDKAGINAFIREQLGIIPGEGGDI
jgi:hypothetical protein